MAAVAEPSGAVRPGPRDLRRAWWSLAFLPVAFVAAFVVGQGVPAWMGHDVATTEAPLGVMALALLAALVVVALPLLLTSRFSGRAAAAHEQGARLPLIVGVCLVGAFAAVNVFSALMMLIFE